jgi:regulator of PEP synthase PpsR (kinase-PPPase family)
MTKFDFHLVSDATGETLVSLAKAALAQFETAEPEQHLWPMIRSDTQLTQALDGIRKNPGPVLYTFVDHNFSESIRKHCERLSLPCVPVLDPVMKALGEFLDDEAQEKPGRQHEMNDAYFKRIDAIHFCMAHDDGQGIDTIGGADVILVGVSRTSKTPTCIYLANRGIKAANIPIVPAIPLPEQLAQIRETKIIGLVTNPDRLIQIRRNRLLTLKQTPETEYVDLEVVREEVTHARKLFARNKWPVIDVTRRSIEETAAAVLNLLD